MRAKLILLLFSACIWAKAQEPTYDSIYVELEEDTLFGVVVLPENYNPHEEYPAVLFLQGGGEVGLDNYLYEPRLFARAGYIGLICDKAGSGLSSGRHHFRTQSFEEKTTEYLKILDYLSTYPGVDKQQMGIHGMSEGGRLVVHMASVAPSKIDFAISVSGPIESFKENQLYAIEHHLLQRNYSSEVIEQTLIVWDQYYSEVANGQIDQTTIDDISALRISNPNLYLPPASTSLPSSPPRADIHFQQQNDFANIQCPILFQYGLDDRIVDARRSIELIPNNPFFIIKAYERTDHSMNFENNIHPRYDIDKLEFLQSISTD